MYNNVLGKCVYKCTVWGEIRYSAQAQRLEGSEGGAALFEYKILFPKIKFLNI
jgi:hypothetical protein